MKLFRWILNIMQLYNLITSKLQTKTRIKYDNQKISRSWHELRLMFCSCRQGTAWCGGRK